VALVRPLGRPHRGIPLSVTATVIPVCLNGGLAMFAVTAGVDGSAIVRRFESAETGTHYNRCENAFQ
jgi:hypothetical protein